jgi:PAP2 superfamily
LLLYDRALGFDFRSYLDFANHHPGLLRVLGPAYSSIGWQMVTMVIVIPVAGFYRRTGEAICAYILALLATTCISILVPAIGVYGTLGLEASDFPRFEPQGYYDTLRDAPLLRAGNLHALNLLQLVGVLTFPSFHAVSAILYIWTFWPLRWLRPFVVFLNIALIAGTPLGGGHYLVDIIAGIAVAAIAIVATHAASKRLSPRPSDKELPVATRRAELALSSR